MSCIPMDAAQFLYWMVQGELAVILLVSDASNIRNHRIMLTRFASNSGQKHNLLTRFASKLKKTSTLLT